jgi:phospholipase/lecithinase/hemolysin
VYQTGLRSFLFLNVPPTDRSPASLNRSTAPNQKAQIATFNSLMVDRVNAFKNSRKDASAILFDVNALLSGILDNATQYGFTNTTG